jgi:hypothetical protein
MTPTPRPRRQLWPHIVLSLAIFAFASQGIGYRAIWQDEIETAERARTIVESGVPRVIDRSGELSLNWGGHELEDGTAHRYNTWGQFYLAAVGLALGRAAGMHPDAAVRVPSVASEAATAGLISYGLSAFAGTPMPVSVIAGAAVALQTPRLVHSRTARYHGLLDLLTTLGLIAIGGLRHDYRWAPWLFAGVLFGLPHTHVFGGSVLSLGLSVLALYVSLARPALGWPARLRHVATHILIPGVVSAGLVVWIVRPWQHTALGALWAVDPWKALSPETVANVRHLSYAAAGILIGLALLAYQRRWGAAVTLGTAAVAMIVGIRFFDFHSLTQAHASRYYLAAPLLALFWPIALGFNALAIPIRNVVVLAMCAVAVTPELLPSRAGNRMFEPFWGVRLVLSDTQHARAGDTQPLHRAMATIRQRAQPGDPVAVDYVPQYVPWYLPGHPTALVPDPAGRHQANWDNPAWQRPMLFPRWHVRYSEWPNGLWPCAPNCDFRSSGDISRGHYELTSKTLGRTERFCIHGHWPTHPWNNAPFMNYRRQAMDPEGAIDGALIVGGPCPSSP